jgi:hypothetical protein
MSYVHSIWVKIFQLLTGNVNNDLSLVQYGCRDGVSEGGDVGITEVISVLRLLEALSYVVLHLLLRGQLILPPLTPL